MWGADSRKGKKGGKDLALGNGSVLGRWSRGSWWTQVSLQLRLPHSQGEITHSWGLSGGWGCTREVCLGMPVPWQAEANSAAVRYVPQFPTPGSSLHIFHCCQITRAAHKVGVDTASCLPQKKCPQLANRMLCGLVFWVARAWWYLCIAASPQCSHSHSLLGKGHVGHWSLWWPFLPLCLEFVLLHNQAQARHWVSLLVGACWRCLEFSQSL